MRTVVSIKLADNIKSPGENRWKFSIGSIWMSWYIAADKKKRILNKY